MGLSKKTGEAGAYAVLGAVYLGIMILFFGPFSGIFVDRWNRKLVLIISDLMAGVLTILIFLLFHFNKMEVMYLFIITGITGVFFHPFNGLHSLRQYHYL